jgi:hypothetical protein
MRNIQFPIGKLSRHSRHRSPETVTTEKIVKIKSQVGDHISRYTPSPSITTDGAGEWNNDLEASESDSEGIDPLQPTSSVHVEETVVQTEEDVAV